jgi:hypothetical protein
MIYSEVILLKYFKLAAFLNLALLCFAPQAEAASLTVMIGDNDGFGGTNGVVAIPGSAYVNFDSPAIAPATYTDEAGTDRTTVAPWTPYKFIFNFLWDTTTLGAITSASVTVDSGSVARRPEGTGFGYASVSASGGGPSLALGDFWTTSTGGGGGLGEETVKAHVFEVTSLITAGTTGTLTFTIDGSSLTGPTDQFALDFARLDIDGGSAVPEPGTGGIVGAILVIVILLRFFSAIGSSPANSTLSSK